MWAQASSHGGETESKSQKSPASSVGKTYSLPNSQVAAPSLPPLGFRHHLISARQQWAVAWGKILIPCPGIEPKEPEWKPGILATKPAGVRG